MVRVGDVLLFIIFILVTIVFVGIVMDDGYFSVESNGSGVVIESNGVSGDFMISETGEKFSLNSGYKFVVKDYDHNTVTIVRLKDGREEKIRKFNVSSNS